MNVRTKRREQVIRLVAEGHGNKEIAATLGISLRTVRDHIQTIYRLLGYPVYGGPSYRVRLTRWAIKCGIATLIFLATLPAHATGALVLVGGCAATATSCTPTVIGGHSFAAGDIQYTFAYRSAVTAPTKPASFTALDTGSANSSSFRSGCLVLTTTTPDSSVWTNATRVESLVYSGGNAIATADCVTHGVGFHVAAGTSGTTSTYTFTGGALTITDGSSTVVAAVGSSAATCIPTSPAYTSRETTTDGIIADLENTTAAATGTCTGTAGNWKTDVVELIASPTAGTPTLIQFTSSASTNSGTDPTVGTGTDNTYCSVSGVPGCYSMWLANPSLTGNILIACVTYSGTSSSVVMVDNKANTWVTDKVQSDATNSQSLIIAHTTQNNAAGVTTVLLENNTGATLSNTQGMVAEFNNVYIPDAAAVGTTVSATAVASGSITPNYSGDLVLQCGFNSGTANFTAVGGGGLTAGSSFTWGDYYVDAFNLGMAEQWRVYNSTSAINPTFTQGGTTAVVTIGMTYESGGIGTALPAGIRVFKGHSVNTLNETAASTVFTLPTTSGNLFVQGASAGCTIAPTNCNDLTAVSDSVNGSWTQICHLVPSGTVSIYYLKNASTGAVTTVTNTTTADTGGHGGTYKFYEIVGASTTAPLDTGFGTSGCSSANGTQAPGGAGGPVATGINNAVPSNANEVGILKGSIAFDTAVTWTSPTGMGFDGCFFDGITNPTWCDENDPNAVHYNGASVASFNPTFTHTTTDSAGVGNWVVAMAMFKAPSAAAAPSGRPISF